MGWFSKLSELHIKLATLFERLDGLSNNVDGLARDLGETARRVARVEGAIANSATPEILRQLNMLFERMAAIEERLGRIDSVMTDVVPELPSPDSQDPDNALKPPE
ncbi:MAG: hypothetical protein IH900_11320 [Proteobacteria bacterium]|nr:hypothetical protein [Pseudomonadota bacterium]